MPFVMAVHGASSVLAGVAWGAFAVVFTAAVPYAIIWFGVRRGTLTDHHIGQREQRRKPLLMGLAVVLLGIAALVVLRAPRELIAMVVVMFVVGLGATAVNHYWKLSIHAAVASGSVAALVLAFGPVWLAGAVLVALVGWSRVVLRDHTTAQVLVGAVAGAVSAGPTFALMV
nr:hypothetical protein [Virgisporangium aliadipatigenens]